MGRLGIGQHVVSKATRPGDDHGRDTTGITQKPERIERQRRLKQQIDSGADDGSGLALSQSICYQAVGRAGATILAHSQELFTHRPPKVELRPPILRLELFTSLLQLRDIRMHEQATRVVGLRGQETVERQMYFNRC